MDRTGLLGLAKDTWAGWNEDKAPRLGAALAYYSLFSIAPLLLIAVAIAGLVFGRQAAEGHLFGNLRGLVGDQAAATLQKMAHQADRPQLAIPVQGASIGLLVLGASGVFGQLKEALDTIWEVEQVPAPGLRGVLTRVKDQFLSVVGVLGTGFLLMVSLVLSAALSAAGHAVGGLLPGGAWVWGAVDGVVSFGVVAGLFAAMFKFLPSAEVAWKDVAVGALVTALLFTGGKAALGLYLGHGTFASVYGAAGSLVVVLVWVYYSAQILFLGAEITKAWANRFGSRIRPAPDARPVTAEGRAQQGLAPARRPAEPVRREPSFRAALGHRHPGVDWPPCPMCERRPASR